MYNVSKVVVCAIPRHHTSESHNVMDVTNKRHLPSDETDDAARGGQLDGECLKEEAKTVTEQVKKKRKKQRAALARLQAVAVRDACQVEMRAIDTWYKRGDSPNYEVEICYHRWSQLQESLNYFLRSGIFDSNPSPTFADVQRSYAYALKATQKVKREHLKPLPRTPRRPETCAARGAPAPPVVLPQLRFSGDLRT